VHGHARLLSLALDNLVRNACEAMPAGGTIGIRIEDHHSRMRITVWDDGPGIPTDQREQLFDEPWTTKRHGSGLGLLLARAIVEYVHDGNVSFAPNNPHGAQFHIILPLLGER
jgi:two-component system, NtrC family, sensor histidine kinase HydH